jgi:hypothetical protein
VVPSRDSHTGRVTEQFREVFETWRAKTMPAAVDASAWHHSYRLAMNTRLEATTATTWRFEIGGEVVDIPIENVYFPSAWITSGFDAGYDVALLRLPRPFRGVRPAALYTDRHEVGKVITTLGYGTTGNGQTGNLLPSGAPGDSGGGAFVMAGSGSRVLGVVSRGYSPNGRAESAYGTTAVYTRVSSNLDWIRSVTAGQQMPMPTLLAQVQQGTLMRAAAVSKQRAEMAAAKGYRVVRFVGEGAPEPSAKKPR